MMLKKNALYNEWLKTQERIKERISLKEHFTERGWHTEIAGTFMLSARQTGKTTCVNFLIDAIRDKYPRNRTVVVTPYKSMLNVISDNADLKLKAEDGTSFLHAVNGNTDHLIVDEFMFLTDAQMFQLLNIKWQSVTMIGSMK